MFEKEPLPSVGEDTASETIHVDSPRISGDEKPTTLTTAESDRDGTRSPSTRSLPKNNEVLQKVPTTTEDETTKDESAVVNSSAEGVEYITGLKLVLMLVALCLAVFLIALVTFILSSFDPQIC